MPSIRKSIGKGIFYTALAKYSNIVTSILITAVLARLLTPAEYGTIAIVMVFTTFFTYLADFGIGPAIIQNKELGKEDIESIFSVSILVALLLSSLFFLSADLIAGFYAAPELTGITRLLSVSVLIFTLNVVPSALNKKELKFRQVGLLSVVVHVIGGILAVVLALLEFSYYALIFRSLITGLLMFAGSYYLNPVKVNFRIRGSSILKIWRFSTFQFLFNFINYFARNTDNLLIGKFLGSAMLGFYDKAFNLMLMPVQNLTHVITPVLHPVLSEFQHNKDRIHHSYLKLTRILATIGFPLSVFCFFAAREIIYLFYGSQWTESIPVFRLLALLIGLEVLLSSSGSIYQSANRADLLLVSGLITSTFIVLGILYGIFIEGSLAGVAKGLIVARTSTFFLSVYLLVRKALGFPLRRFLSTLVMPLFISAVVLVANLLFSQIAIDNLYLEFALKFMVSFGAFLVAFSCSKNNRLLIVQSFHGLRNKIKGYPKLAALYSKIF
ncbi:MAG: lipopolysaccharide biosynthesis protein [Prolixibacteraceae bacterium]